MSCNPRSPADDPECPVPGTPGAIEQPAAANPLRATSAQPRARRLPSGLRVLVVEHNFILALDVEDMLLRHGVAQVVIASTAGEALAHLRQTAFDAALVDLKLPRSGALEVALCLQELAIPFAFAIGYGERVALPARFSDRLVIGKPYSEPYLMSRLAELVARCS